MLASSYAGCKSKRAGDGAIHSHRHTDSSTSFVSLVRSLSFASLFVHHTPWRWSRRNVSLSQRQSRRLSYGRSVDRSVVRLFVRLLRFVNLSVGWFVAVSVARVDSLSIGQALRRPFPNVLITFRSGYNAMPWQWNISVAMKTRTCAERMRS